MLTQWTDDDDKLPESYPNRKYMMCMVLNIIQWTVEMSPMREDMALSQCTVVRLSEQLMHGYHHRPEHSAVNLVANKHNLGL